MDIQRAKPDSMVDLSEKGRNPDGRIISLDRRLYMQFMVFGAAQDSDNFISALPEAGIQGVLYEDLNDPNGLGLLTLSENPDVFLTQVRPLLKVRPCASLILKPELTMFGRTYTIGYEDGLERVLIRRPIERVTDPSLTWAVWYPVRRSGAFEQLSPDEQLSSARMGISH